MTEIHSTVRAGQFVRQERLEDEGRIQSWVLAGTRGAVEARGVRWDEIYYLVHRPALTGEFYGGHSLLLLVDAAVFPGDRCTVLEGPCRVTVLNEDSPHECGPFCGSDSWVVLEELYRRHLEDGQ